MWRSTRALALALAVLVNVGCFGPKEPTNGKSSQNKGATPKTNGPEDAKANENEDDAKPNPPVVKIPPDGTDGYVTYGKQQRLYIHLIDETVAIQQPQGVVTDGKLRPEFADLKEIAGLYESLEFELLEWEGVGVVRLAEKSNWNDVATAVKSAQGTRKDFHIGTGAWLQLSGDKRVPVVVLREFIVRYQPNMPREEIDALNEKHGAKIKRPVDYAHNQFVVMAKSPADALKLCDEYRGNDEQVLLAEPNLICHHDMRQTPPNDPLFGKQWHLENNGASEEGKAADVGALEAWKTTAGESTVLIAVLDPQGVQADHEDLKGNQYYNVGEVGPDSHGRRKHNNGVDDDRNGYPDDFSGWNFLEGTNSPRASSREGADSRLRGISREDSTRAGSRLLMAHGTAAAGLAVAERNNGIGVSGLAPGCRLLPIHTGVTVQDDADAFYYAAAQGADVISCSWGYEIGVPALAVVEEAIEAVAKPGPECAGRHGLGCIVVFAMTNEKINNFGVPGDPDSVIDISSHPDVIAVGRSTNTGKWGQSGFGDGMHLLAPSHAALGTRNAGCDTTQLAGTLDVTTTDLMGADGYNTGQQADCFCGGGKEVHENPNYTSCFNGTSASAPLVAGAAALCLSVCPDATSVQIRDDLTSTATKLDGQEAYSIEFGHGRLNAAAAVEASKKQSAARNAVIPKYVARRRLSEEMQKLAFTLTNAQPETTAGILKDESDILSLMLPTDRQLDAEIRELIRILGEPEPRTEPKKYELSEEANRLLELLHAK